MPRQRLLHPRLLALLLPLALPACAHHAIVTYPATPDGKNLRLVYTAPHLKDVGDAISALQQMRDSATRDALKPAMLAIIAQDDSLNALTIALILSEWDPHLAATAPEFHHLIPALARGLRNGNDEQFDNYPTRINAVGATFLLARMSRDAAWPIRKDMYYAFDAPVKSPIKGESADCWTRYILVQMLPCFGEDAVPALICGVDHHDAWVRQCAFEALSMTQPIPYAEGWQIPADQLAAKSPSARAALPKLATYLWDADAKVRSKAAAAVGAVATLETLTPQVHDRLLELFKEADPYGGVRSAIVSLHPVYMPFLLKTITTLDAPHRLAAAEVLVRVGRPAVPELIAALADDTYYAAPGNDYRDSIHGILNQIGPAAIPDLNQAAASAANPLIRERAGLCLNENISNARKTIDNMIPELNNPNAGNRLDSIRRLLPYAPYAANALPALQRLAVDDPDRQVRAAAAAAIEKIGNDK